MANKYERFKIHSYDTMKALNGFTDKNYLYNAIDSPIWPLYDKSHALIKITSKYNFI